MDLTEYGPAGWKFIHALGGMATEEHKRVAFAQWMKLLDKIFPCEICAAHLRQTMKIYPIERFMDSAENLLKYTYILHDSASNYWNSAHPEKARKISPSWEEVKDMYLSIPTPPPALEPVATPLPPSTRAPISGSRMMVTYPAFQQLKSTFRSRR